MLRRPQMSEPLLPRIVIPLNGQWEIEPGGGELPLRWEHSVPVPALVDVAEPKFDWAVHDYHWHRRSFIIQAGDKTDLAFLKIEQAMFGTEVWVNGVRAGSDIACYTSQEYDVSGLLKYGNENELIVRVGAKHTLPAESAVGKDQERTEFIPGIWGDVYVTMSGSPRVRLVQVIPSVEKAEVEVRVTVDNRSVEEKSFELTARVFEKRTGRGVSSEGVVNHVLGPNRETVLSFSVAISEMKLWSVEDPFLYEVETVINANGRSTDSLRTTFGMREFKVVGSDFYFNGNRVFLKGGNIAFHRFLSDADRRLLPWDAAWVKELLIDIPKAHNFNFFRAHIGHMYNRWYDIADEHGMLIQNEWQFWETSGTRAQIEKEFTRWLHDNWNHPSIIIWDALNECTDEIVQKEVVPAMKRLEPTRPWESADFVEDHPYIYSLGPVLNDRKFGFTRSLNDIENSPAPSLVNEFLWWWLDKNNNPTMLTRDVVDRWMGPQYTQEELIAHQSFLAQELVELFRRMRVDAIQPFVYLSNNAGPTGHWFLGDVKDLQPKPVLKALKNAFSPFGISIELWDRHFVVGEQREVRLFILNDGGHPKRGAVRYGVVNRAGTWISQAQLDVRVDAAGCSVVPVVVGLPKDLGTFKIRAELMEEYALDYTAYSEKSAHVFGPLHVPDNLREAPVAIIDQRGELSEFLGGFGISCLDPSSGDLQRCNVIVVGEGLVASPAHKSHAAEVGRFVRSGGVLVLSEPEFGIESREMVPIIDGIELIVERRTDFDRGGYDSYVFAEDHRHPVWNGIDKEHLKMFNGGFGGEVVSQHDVCASVPWIVLARCGLKLKTAALAELQAGEGKVVVSRLQVRGRLVGSKQRQGLFSRRIDPVAQQYVLNLLSAYTGGAKGTNREVRGRNAV